MSGTELSRVRTEFRLRPPEPINESDSSRAGPTLLCNQVGPSTYVPQNPSLPRILVRASIGIVDNSLAQKCVQARLKKN